MTDLNESQPRLHSSRLNGSHFSLYHLFFYLANLLFVCRLLPNTCLGCLFPLTPAHLCLTSPSPSDSCDSNTTRRVKRKPRTEKEEKKKRQPRLPHCFTPSCERRRDVARHLTRLRHSDTQPPLLFCFLQILSALQQRRKMFFTPASHSQRVRGPGLFLGVRVSPRRVPAGF